MPTNENRCIESLNNIQRLFGKQKYKELLMHIEKSNDLKNRNVLDTSKPETILKLVLDKFFIKLFNGLHGTENRNINVFIDILNYKYYNKDCENLIRYFRHEIDQHFDDSIVDQVNALLLMTIRMREKYCEKKIKLLNMEKDYINFLKQLKDAIKKKFQEGKLANKELAFFNIEKMIKLHTDVLNHPKYEGKIYKPYKDNLQIFREVYIRYAVDKSKVETFYMENLEYIKDEFFENEKTVNEIFTRPMDHFFVYLPIFKKLHTNCFIAEERCFSFLVGSFKDLIGMANETKRRKDGNAFLNEIKGRIEEYDKLRKRKFGDLLFNTETDMIFRKNQRRYLILLFELGFSILFCNEKGNYSLLENFEYSKMVKCEIYREERKNILKIIWKGKKAREMIIIPFEKYENIEKIKLHIENHIKKAKPDEELKDEIEKGQMDVIKEKINKGDVFAMKVEFGSIHFLDIIEKKIRLNGFKRHIIAKIGEKLEGITKIEERSITLKYFQNFNFYIRDDERLFLLENDAELQAANLLFDSKLDVVIDIKDEKENTM